jgi:hypothetical protein
VPDGTHELRATATDAANQEAVATAMLRVDRTAPTAPEGLGVSRNADGTLALGWANPDQGTAAPIVAARYQVCDALGVACSGEHRVVGAGIVRVDSVDVPPGDHAVRVWLEDEAGHADAANAGVLHVDPNTVGSPRVVETRPPVLLPPGPAPSPRLRVTKARRSGSVLTLSGTIARGARTAVTARLARTRNGRTVASARTRPKRGKWSVKVRLTPSLRRAGAMYLTVTYAGQQSYRKVTLHRKLTRKPVRRSDTATEFSVERR